MLHKLLISLPFMSPERAQLVIDAFFPMLKAGFVVSVPLALVSFAIGMVIAIGVALVRVTPLKGFWRMLLPLTTTYISIIRGTPLLVQLCIVFYGLPAIGIFIDPIPSAIIGFSLNVGAYGSETIRAGILSVNKGQWEAGFSGGLTYLQTFVSIIAPQAFRVALPSLSNNFIGLFKDTSLASVVTVTELFRAAQQVANSRYDFLPVYIEAGLVYWCFCYFMFVAQHKMEQRLGRSFVH